MSDTPAVNPTPAPAGRPPRSRGQVVGLGLILLLGLSLIAWLWTHPVWLSWADRIALGLTLVCVGAGVRLLIDSTDPRVLGRRMEVEGDSTETEARQARMQALLLLALGVCLVLPPAASALQFKPAWAAYVPIAALGVARLVYARHFLKTGDEFQRRRVQEAQSIILILLQGGLLFYAGAERLGLVAQASAWEILVLLTLAGFIVPSIVHSRRRAA